MLSMILTVLMQAAPVHAQVQTCVWPNRCARKAQVRRVAQVQPCVWPRLCKKTA